MPFPYLSFWILETVARQFWPLWILALLFAWGFRRFSSKGWLVFRLLARFGFGLVCLATFVLVGAFCYDLHFSLTATGSALMVKGGDAEFGVIFADAAGRPQLRTYRIAANLGIDLAAKANRFRSRPIPIIRLKPEAPAPPPPQRPSESSAAAKC